jgi:threonine aldolase
LIIVGEASHIFVNEAGSSSAVGGIHPHTVPTQPDGTLRLDDIAGAIRPVNDHYPETRLIALENTQNRTGGTALSVSYTRLVADLAHQHGLVLHIDGARIFNAAVALGVDVADLTRDADSVTFCLSKGLGAPVGSVLCGTKAFIQKARRKRKMLGGGMRQGGILAAAGLYALEHNIHRLSQDHANARNLANSLATIPGLHIDLNSVHTNMVYFDLLDVLPFNAEELCHRATTRGVKLSPVAPRRIRAVTHCWVSDVDIDTTIQVLAETTQI